MSCQAPGVAPQPTVVVEEADAPSAAATAVAAIPTQAAAPPAPGAPVEGRLLIATTRPSTRPRSDLPIDYRLAFLSRSGLQPIRLPDDERGVLDATVIPDRSAIVAIVGGESLVRLRTNGDIEGDLLPRLDPLTATRPDRYLSVGSAGGSSLLVWQTAPTGLLTVDLDGSNVRRLPVTGLRPAMSPDGSQVALGLAQDQPFYSIHITDLSFGPIRKLTDDVLTESSAAWSPDGAWIAYAANAGYPQRVVAWEVRIIRPDGTGKGTIAPRMAGVSYPEVRWSPDGRQIAFTRYHEANRTRQIGIVDLQTGRELILSDSNANDRVLGWLP